MLPLNKELRAIYMLAGVSVVWFVGAMVFLSRAVRSGGELLMSSVVGGASLVILIAIVYFIRAIRREVFASTGEAPSK